MNIIRETTADTVNLPHLMIHPGMGIYSGWNYTEHLNWVNELTGLHIPQGSIIVTDESCSEVWLLAETNYKAKCKLIFEK